MTAVAESNGDTACEAPVIELELHGVHKRASVESVACHGSLPLVAIGASDGTFASQFKSSHVATTALSLTLASNLALQGL